MNETKAPSTAHAYTVELCGQLVGNLMMDLDAAPLIFNLLPPAVMPQCDSRDVYEAMCHVYFSAANNLTVGNVRAELRKRDLMGHLTDLQNKIEFEAVETLERWADEIREYAMTQELKARCLEVATLADKAGARMEHLQPMLVEPMKQIRTAHLKDISEFMDALDSDLDKWEQGIAIEGRSLGFKSLDNILRLEDGQLYLIGARPGMGKTSIGMQIFEHVAQTMQREGETGCVAVFSAEMSGKQLALRMSCALAGTNSQLLRFGGARPEDYQRTREAKARIAQLPIKIDEDSSPSPEQIYYRTSLLNAVCPVRAILFDFLELGNPDDKNSRRIQSEEQRVSAIGQGLQRVARSLNIPVVALSQLSREVEKRADKLPTLADLRYSGKLEAVANKVIFLMRPEYYLEQNQSCFLDPAFGDPTDKANHPHAKGVCYFNIAKYRDGAPMRIPLQFTAKYTRFGDLYQEE